MGKRSLELTCTETQFWADGIINPGLLKNITSRGSCVHTDIIIYFAKGLTCESDNGIGYGKT